MNQDSIVIELSPLQVSHTILALKEYAKQLLKDSEDNPEGGEHEDYLILQSVIKTLSNKKQ